MLKEIPSSIKTYSKIYLAVMALGIIVNVGSAYLYGSSWINAFGVIYQLQVLMSIPLIGVDIGEDVLAFYRLIHHLFISFSFISSKVTFFGLGHLFDVFEFPQTDWYLFALEFTDGSGIVNIHKILFVVLLIVWATILTGIFYSCTKDQEPDSNRFAFSKKIYQFFGLCVSIRVMMLVYMYLLV